MPTPLVSIIVLNYNGKEYLRRCLLSLQRITYENCEFLVVDNASTDGSIELVENEFPWTRIIKNDQNLGFARANNIAASKVKGKYLFFLNMDTWVHRKSLTELVKVAEQDPTIGVCACKIMDYDGKRELTTGLSCDIYGHVCPTYYGGEVIFAEGAAMFVRRDVFDELDGFDSKYFMFNEDLDFCWRALLSGYKVVSTPSAIIYHKSGAAIVGGAPRGVEYVTSIKRRYLGERNMFRTILKNYSTGTLFRILPRTLALSLTEALLLLLMGNVKVTVNAYFRAFLWNSLNFRDTWRLHCKTQSVRKISDGVIQRKMVKIPARILDYQSIGVPVFKD